MEASKENAKASLDKLRKLSGTFEIGSPQHEDCYDVEQFLEAAVKRLPHQKSIDKERNRHRDRKQVS